MMRRVGTIVFESVVGFFAGLAGIVAFGIWALPLGLFLGSSGLYLVLAMWLFAVAVVVWGAWKKYPVLARVYGLVSVILVFIVWLMAVN